MPNMKNKAVLISINPKWCDLIFNGQKTMEVRKSFPKLDAPFRAIVYCTKAKNPNENFWVTDETGYNWLGNGKVIGEFICAGGTDLREVGGTEFFKRSCMTYDDFRNYTDYTKHIIWGWDVEKPMLYAKPKELEQFNRYCDSCGFPLLPFQTPPCDKCPGRALTHPPQSWCYVEEQTRSEQNAKM